LSGRALLSWSTSISLIAFITLRPLRPCRAGVSLSAFEDAQRNWDFVCLAVILAINSTQVPIAEIDTDVVWRMVILRLSRRTYGEQNEREDGD
jgi:hypothetical protein